MDDECFYRKKIGRKIKLARTKSHFTQEKLAEQISLSTRYISQLERGISFGSAKTIVNICKALSINPNFLFEDLLKDEDSIPNSLIDDKFMETYIKLNDTNKKVVTAIVKELVKLQNEDTAS